MKRIPFLSIGPGKCWHFLLSAALFLAPLAGVYALTASEIIDRARIMLRDTATDTTRQRYSDSQLLAWVNDGQREANSFAWILQSSFTITLAGGTTEYALPANFQASWRVLYKNKKLDQTSFNQLDAESLTWTTVTGDVQKYYIYLATSTWIGFYPAPVSASTGTATVYFLQQPDELTSTTETPWNGWLQLAPYHSALAYFVAYRGLWTIGDTNQAERYLQEWNQWISVMKHGVMQAPDFNPGFGGRREQ